MTNLDSVLKQRHPFADKGPYSQSYGFSSSCIQMWELDHKKGWVLKNWYFQIVVLKKTLRVPWMARRWNQSINPKGNQPWIYIGRSLAESGAPTLWPPDVKSWLIGKTLRLGKIEGKRRRQWQRMRWLDRITNSVDMNLNELWEIVEDRWA